jgi:DNA-binding transcriptional LysR family regulator
MIDLKALRAFVVIGERLNMTRAAEVLHISQSALSRQIQGLEHNLGIRLFDRIGKRLVLTAEGDDLLPRAAALIDQAQNLSTRMKAITQRTDWRTANRRDAPKHRSPALARCQQAAPEVSRHRGDLD